MRTTRSGGAAHQKLFDGTAAMRADNNQIDIVAAGVIDNAVGDIGALLDDRNNVQRLPIILGDEGLELPARVVFQVLLEQG